MALSAAMLLAIIGAAIYGIYLETIRVFGGRAGWPEIIALLIIIAIATLITAIIKLENRCVYLQIKEKTDTQK